MCDGRSTVEAPGLDCCGCLTVPDQGPLQLDVLQADQLRVALRDAFLSLEQLAGPDGLAGSRRPELATPPPVRPPSSRQRVPIRIPARPSVSEIAARLTNLPTK